MKRFWIVAAGLIVCLAALAFTSQAEQTSVQGDYVEVRTASVFAGACHFNGEVVTTGRDALMAWHVTSGSWNATDLTGVRAIANDLCCRMPNLVWYDPLVPLGQRKVGYTIKALYAGHTTSDPWQRADENSAFYGSFSF